MRIAHLVSVKTTVTRKMLISKIRRSRITVQISVTSVSGKLAVTHKIARFERAKPAKEAIIFFLPFLSFNQPPVFIPYRMTSFHWSRWFQTHFPKRDSFLNKRVKRIYDPFFIYKRAILCATRNARLNAIKKRETSLVFGEPPTENFAETAHHDELSSIIVGD